MSDPVLPATSAALDLTHVLYDPNSYLSLALALITLSPVLLMASYAALAVQTREATIIFMWAGQLLCEAFNYVLKKTVKQERPLSEHGPGYGFPSSHSQWMGYFASFLICHFYFRHHFASTGYRGVDILVRLLLYTGLIVWASAVAYSRYYLRYHSPIQVLAGVLFGVLFGVTYYTLVELIPTRKPTSRLGALRAWLVGNPLSTWVRVRDGWVVWADGGSEVEWQRWRAEWTKMRRVEVGGEGQKSQ